MDEKAVDRALAMHAGSILAREVEELRAEVRRLRAENERECQGGNDLARRLNAADERAAVDAESHTFWQQNAFKLRTEVERLWALHSPETAEVEDENGISTTVYCGHDGHPWPCPSMEGRA